MVCGDGCLMEGVSHEAISLAGHLGLDNLVLLFDDNGITIDGNTDLSTSEDHIQKFAACGWKTIEIDGHDYENINSALNEAQSSDKPVMIACKTIIGKFCGDKEGTSASHGSPLSLDEIQNLKNNLGWEAESFEVPGNILANWRSLSQRNQDLYNNSTKEQPILSSANIGWERIKQELVDSTKDEATRKSSQRVLEKLHSEVSNLIGGSADLTPSNNTKTSGQQIINKESFLGSYLHYGIREHAMAAIMNGISCYGGFDSIWWHIFNI